MANEEATAVPFVDAVLRQCLAGNFASVKFLAILDRACTDKTLELLKAHATKQPLLDVVWAPENKGIVDAYIRGYREALARNSDWILEIDAGFSHQPEDIPQFLEKMAEGYDCVFGSRFCQGGRVDNIPWTRLIVSRGGTWLTNLMLKTKLQDMTSGFELFSRAALQAVLTQGIRSRGKFFQTEIKTICRNMRIAEVPIHYRSPTGGIGSSELADSFINLWRLYRVCR
ncbi:MAG TPA: glycosyltransferase [Terriglobales bacterium]|nr:glycosyltransferase [Terriglobales bacterium]